MPQHDRPGLPRKDVGYCPHAHRVVRALQRVLRKVARGTRHASRADHVSLAPAARILLTASLAEEEESFDKYLPEFTNIVGQIEWLLSNSSTRFSIDTGVVPILYYVAIKCRHP